MEEPDSNPALPPPEAAAQNAVQILAKSMVSDQSQLVKQLQELLQEEDRLLDETLAEQRRNDSEWSGKLEKIMFSTIKHQNEFENKIAAFRSVAVGQQEILGTVAKEVKALMTDYPREFEHHEQEESAAQEGKQLEQQAMGLQELPGAGSPKRGASGTDSVGKMDKKLKMDYFDRVRANSGLARMVCSTPFDAICTIVITVNAVYIGVSVEYTFNHIGEPKVGWQRGFEIFFYVFYLVELLLKLMVHKQHFFYYCPEWTWNVFDLALVVSATYDVVNEYVIDDGGGGANLMWMRLLRIMKMLKLMRMVRVMRFFRELRMMLNLIGKSMRSLFWAFLMLMLIMYLFGLCFLQGVTGYLTDTQDTIDPKVKVAIEKYWDSVYDAIATLLAAVTRGIDWRHASKALEEVGQVYHILFLFYISFASFAVLNVLTGIFVDASFDAAASDRASVASEALSLSAAQGNKLVKLLSQWCSVPDMLDLQQLLKCCEEDDAVKAIVSEMEISEPELTDLHINLAKANSVDGMVRVKYIAEGMMRLKGPAQAMDVVQLTFSAGKYEEAFDNFMHYVEEQFVAMRRSLQIRLHHHTNYVIPLKARLNAARKMPIKVFSS